MSVCRSCGRAAERGSHTFGPRVSLIRFCICQPLAQHLDRRGALLRVTAVAVAAIALDVAKQRLDELVRVLRVPRRGRRDARRDAQLRGPEQQRAALPGGRAALRLLTVGVAHEQARVMEA